MGKKIINKNLGKGGKPPKLTKTFITVLKEVLAEDEDFVLLTDEKILSLVNEKLPQDKKIGQRTFREWKTGNSPKHAPNEARAFRLLIKRALVKQEIALIKKMKSDDKGWQRFAWILERKFNEWNIRHKTDVTSDGEQIVGFNFVAPTGEK